MESTRPRLLLVEDDRELTGLLADLLTEEGYDVDVAPDGHRGLHHALTRDYQVMVVDRGLPALDGLELVARLRGRGVACPVLLLTARGSVADRVDGLDAGAEDYLVKPFEVAELLARLRALLRRHPEAAGWLPVGRRRLDVANRRVVEGTAEFPLSAREFAVLHALAGRPSKVFTRAELLSAAFGRADAPGTVDACVHHLRRKLGRDVVRTVHGLGYRLGGQ
ncbi:response regulator transcription factor [Micromonospora mirobrigensis]|uniref:DNA-binding response regulator, OmpR family, contains REC and winged-helix (WHTH) domain n=1 Tax=Micromonospora mirobrigensis TaxID=262898 RepID=A0A1C4V4S6_9ACTN|nr:response regulator transcription factor [Micromonospora mirobrigensis]SCE78749.1 DNA-binding response regulator, OmpR family, contains REC and winged-helix (wHTH) domain [Micromonospora mirobrigensis]